MLAQELAPDARLLVRASGADPRAVLAAVKSRYMRASRASGSDRAKVELLIRRGWHPGLSYGEALARKGRKQRRYAGGGHYGQ